MIKNLFCGVLAFVMLASVVAKAADPGIEIRKRNSIGRLALTGIKPTVKTEADGTMIVSFQAPADGTYYLIYTNGPKAGKNATSVNVAKAGPATVKIKK